MKVWNNRHPVVLVPTNYFTTPTDEFRKHSTLQNNNILDVSMVIWANHNVRAAVKAMQDTTNQIKKTAHTHTHKTKYLQMFKSQYGQDQFVDTWCNSREGGVFVDVGAHDGVTLSNTWFFENVRKWTGLCIEPIPEIFNQLKENRPLCKLFQ